jgi:hypothetical protein
MGWGECRSTAKGSILELALVRATPGQRSGFARYTGGIGGEVKNPVLESR